ncbi:MAG: hypothetical protein KKC42_02580 [Candidatus Omnitrophica bacterium]|nr:hypothetical protein [Candidatus Omnitrophota bacterium]
MLNQEFVKTRNPLDYLKIFFRRKWLFIGPASVGIVLGIMACFILPPEYESSTTILVEEEKIINPLIQNLAVSTTAAQRMQSIREILLGWNSLVELTEKLNLAKNIKNQLQFESFINDLRESINVRMRQPNIIQISYIGKEPQETQLVTQTLTDILVAKNMQSQTKETDVAINFIQEQLVIYKRKIKESEIAKLEDELKNLLIDSTDQHPMVKELRHKIAVTKQEFESGEFKVAAEAPINDAASESLKKELDRIIEEETRAISGSTVYASEARHDPNNAIYKLLLMDKVGSSVARDINVNERIYQMLLERLETAKITQRLEVSKEGTRYTIIEPARMPLKSARPNKLKVLFLGIILGGFAGTGLVFGREFLDQSFLDIDDAKQNLEQPVLGAISRITTEEEIEKEKHKEVSFITVFLVVSFVLIILSIVISMMRK